MRLRVYVLIVTIVIFIVSLSLQAGEVKRIPVGKEYEVEGVIVGKTEEGLRVRSHDGFDFLVILGNWSDIQEKKKNFFRSPDNYSEDELILGLNIRVEGRGDSSGALIGEKIRFTRDELKIARAIYSSSTVTEEKLTSVEKRMEENQNRTEARLGDLDTRSEQASNEMEELNVALRLTRQEAAKANEKADKTIERIELTENRLLDLDKYNEIKKLTIQFAFNSTDLTDDSQKTLDEVVYNLSELDGYLIEIVGFASSDGDSEYNRKLSQQRAEAVTNYLAEKHEIPLWRLVRPFGFGETKPVADNSTKHGREQNRRVELRLLQSQGIAGTL